MADQITTLTTENYIKPTGGTFYALRGFSKRGVVNLSDGSVVVCLVDGADIKLYHSTDRNTWTLKNTISGITLPYTITTGAFFGHSVNIVNDPDDNLYLAAGIVSGTTSATTTIKYLKLTYASGPTWTEGTAETVDTQSGSNYAVGEVDIDVTKDGIPVIIYSATDNFGSSDKARYGIRGSSDGSWIMQDLSDDGFQLTIAVDPGDVNDDGKISFTMGSVKNVAPSSRNIYTGFLDPETGESSVVKNSFLYSSLSFCPNVAFALGDNEFIHCEWMGVRRFKIGSDGSYVDLGSNFFSPFTNEGTVGTYTEMRSLQREAAWALSGHFNEVTNTTTWTVGIFVNGLNYIGLTYLVHLKSHQWLLLPGSGLEHHSQGGINSRAAGYAWTTSTSGEAGSGGIPTGLGITAGARRNQDLDEVPVDTFFYTYSSKAVYFQGLEQRPDRAPYPALTSPVDGSTLTSGTPTFTATDVTGEGGDNGPYAQGDFYWECQASPYADFSSGVKHCYDDVIFLDTTAGNYDGQYRQPTIVSGGATFDLSQKLPQGLLYFRLVKRSLFGKAIYTTDPVSATVTHAPSVSDISPSGGATLLWQPTVNISAKFTDPDTSAKLSAYQVVIEKNSDGSSVLDSGKVTTTAVNWGQRFTVPVQINGTYKDVELRVKIKAWNDDDVDGEYSDYSLFYVRDNSGVVIDAPTENQQLDTASPQFVWTFTAGGSRVQASFLISILDTSGTQVYSSGIISSADTVYTVTENVLENGQMYTGIIRVTDNTGLTTQESVRFSVSYDRPAQPITTIDDSFVSSDGYVLVQWTSDWYDSRFLSYRVYRREVGTTAWAMLFETTDSNKTLYSFKDYLYSNLKSYQYAVSQVVTAFGSPLESLLTYVDTADINDDKYWLVPSDDSSVDFGNLAGIAIPLTGVTSDSYTDEYEEESIKIIGRGRRHEYGTHYGINGSLSVQIRPIMNGTVYTGGEIRQQLVQAKANKQSYLLRTPFGDVYKVAMGNIQFARVAGLGTADATDVTLPYEEVYA